jgi:hypothetical protein
MHPEFLREMTDIRGRELRAKAHQARMVRLARLVSRGRRHGRDSADEADGFVMPAIPDYADGSFRTESAVTEAGGVETGQEPAAHHAA